MSWKKNLSNVEPKASNPKLEAMWPRPVANYAQWKDFKYCSPRAAFSSEEKRNLFALDVLDGDPDLNLSESPYDIGSQTVPNIGNISPLPVPRLAQGLVPERIRLNGPQFSETFRVIDSSAFAGFDFSPIQMTLLQPYRLLMHHEQDIRHQYETLKKKFGIPSDDENVPTVGLTQASEYHDTTRDDGGYEVRVAPYTVEVAKGSKQEPKESASERNEFPLANSKTALGYLSCLIDFMDSTISVRRAHVQSTECRKVHFRDLWYLFSPGDEVISRDGRQAYKVIRVVNPTHRASSRRTFYNYDDKDASTYFQLSCVHLDFDGRRIGPVSSKFVIKPFAGEKVVESLEVYPLRLHCHAPTLASESRKDYFVSSEAQSLRQKLIKRGKKFFQAACMQLEDTFYDGPTVYGEEVESQVVVDFETALLSGQNVREDSIPQIISLLGDADDSTSTSSEPDDDLDCLGSCCAGEHICDDSFVDGKRRDEYIDSLIPNDYMSAKLPSVAIYPRNLEDTTGENALTDDEFLLMTYRVFAFVLKNRKWGKLICFPLPSAATFGLFGKAISLSAILSRC